MYAIYEGQRGQNLLGYAPNWPAANQVIHALTKRGGIYVAKKSRGPMPASWIELSALHNGRRYSWGRYNDLGANLAGRALSELFSYRPNVEPSQPSMSVPLSANRKSSRFGFGLIP